MSFSTSTTFTKQTGIETELSERPKSDFSSPQPVNTNTDSTLPTHHLPLRTYALPPSYIPTIHSSTNETLTVPAETNTWLSHVKEYAPVVGVVGTITGVVVAIITVAIK